MNADEFERLQAHAAHDIVNTSIPLCENPHCHAVLMPPRKHYCSSACRHLMRSPHPRRDGRVSGGGDYRPYKLNRLDVQRIRALYRMTNMTYNELALEYHVSHQAIYNVINRITWKHVT